MPTMRYGVTPSGLVFTESPVVRIDFVTTPGISRTTYGSCELLGPWTSAARAVPVLPSAIAAASAEPTTARRAVRCFMVRASMGELVDVPRGADVKEGA